MRRAGRAHGLRTRIPITVLRSDCQRLEAIIRDRTAPRKQVWRAYIVLLIADGLGTIDQRLAKYRGPG